MIIVIYDENYVKKLPPVKKYGNPRVVWLCKWEDAKPIHNDIERWMDNIPKLAQPDLTARLRSKDDGSHLGAFYELVFHQFCLEEGWKTDFHYKTEDGKTPDLKLTVGNGDEIIVEIFTMQDTDEERRISRIFDEICEAVNKLTTPYFLSIQFEADPTNGVSVKKVASAIQAWLKTLDGTKKRHYLKYRYSDEAISLRVEARIEDFNLTSGGVLYAIHYPTYNTLSGMDKLKNKLQYKRKKYKSTKSKQPLVLVVGNATKSSFRSEATIDRALYGYPTITFSTDGSDTPSEAGRDNSGLVTPKISDEGLLARNTTISAVISVSSYINHEEKRGEYAMKVFHNPWAVTPLSTEVFTKMPQLAVVQKDERAIKLEWSMDDHEDQRIFFY